MLCAFGLVTYLIYVLDSCRSGKFNFFVTKKRYLNYNFNLKKLKKVSQI